MPPRELLWTGPEIANALESEWESRAGIAVRATGVSTAAKFTRGDVVFSSGDAEQQRQLLAGGAAAVLAENADPALVGSYPVMAVASVDEALLGLAKAARTRFAGKIIGVFGSSADRWATAALAHVLSEQGPTWVGQPEYDSVRGAAFDLVKVPPVARFVIQELAMLDLPTMVETAKLVRPSVAVLAAAVPEGSEVKQFVAAMVSVLESLEAEATAVLPYDSPHLAALGGAVERAGAKFISFGTAQGSSVLLTVDPSSSEDGQITVALPDEACTFGVPTTGKRTIENVLAVLGAVVAAGGDGARAATDLAGAPTSVRGSGAFALRLWNGYATIIDQSSEATMASTLAAITQLKEESPGPGGRRIVVLGELSSAAAPLAAQLAGPLATAGVRQVITVGDGAGPLRGELPHEILGPHCQTPEAAHRALARRIRADDVVLIKGAAATELGRVIDLLQESAAADPSPNLAPG